MLAFYCGVLVYYHRIYVLVKGIEPTIANILHIFVSRMIQKKRKEKMRLSL